MIMNGCIRVTETEGLRVHHGERIALTLCALAAGPHLRGAPYRTNDIAQAGRVHISAVLGRCETQPTPYKVRTMSSIAGSSKVRSTTSVTALTSASTLAAVVSLGLKASRCRWPSRSLPI